MPKLSIITINFNNAVGLKKTMESVVSQSSKDFEYIIIDGGSTDGSVEVIKQYADKVAYWVSEPDKGLYNAQNKGILKAKGQYCQFLNSGDFLVKNDVVEKMLTAVASSASATSVSSSVAEPVEASIYYGNMLKQLGNGKIYRDHGRRGNITMLTFYKSTINHSSAFIKRSLFEKYGMYDESLKIVADWKFYFIAVGLHNESVKYVPIDVTCFDMSGISNANAALDKKERRMVLEQYLPASILADYDNHTSDIEQIKRLKKYSLTKWPVWFVERILFKWEKLKDN